MPTTLSALPFVRRTAVGLSATAQGADGTSELARTAAAALAASDWSVDSAAPSVPVHDFARACPSGDAWKGVYGYKAEARTQRSACGAVVYTFTLPSASGQTVDAIAGTITGDRYLADGVDVHAVLSASATPPTVADLLARTPDATLCATSSQTAPPNDRQGVVAQLDLEPGAAAAAYLHVALLLHDYLGVRGAWIEGGAMLDPATIAVTFSGTVTAPGWPASTLRPISSSQIESWLHNVWRCGLGHLPDQTPGATYFSSLAETVVSGRAPLAAKQLGATDASGVTEKVNGFVWYDRTIDSEPGTSASRTSYYAEVDGAAPVFDGANVRGGMTLTLPGGSSYDAGASVLATLVELPSADARPDVTRADLWAGSAPECLGSVRFIPHNGAGSMKISRAPSTPFVCLLLCPVDFTSVSTLPQYYPKTLPVLS